jgi:hypothetical protein
MSKSLTSIAISFYIASRDEQHRDEQHIPYFIRNSKNRFVFHILVYLKIIFHNFSLVFHSLFRIVEHVAIKNVEFSLVERMIPK